MASKQGMAGARVGRQQGRAEMRHDDFDVVAVGHGGQQSGAGGERASLSVLRCGEFLIISERAIRWRDVVLGELRYWKADSAEVKLKSSQARARCRETKFAKFVSAPRGQKEM